MSGAANLIETPLTKVRDQIARACADAGRDPASVTLVAISKTFGANAIEPVIAEGQRVFGENRVQEAKAKWPSLKERHGGIELHLVGALQSNKAKDAVALFDAIHSLDRPSLAEALAKEISEQGRRPTLFVEVNTGGEAQKSGVLPEETDAFVKACREGYGLQLAGLMCLPPADEPPAPHFALTAKIARRNNLALLSMGMSGHGHFRETLGGRRDRELKFNQEPRLRSQHCQESLQVIARERHASRRRRPIRSRHMNEDGAAPTRHARARVMIDLDDEIVEVIVPP